MPISSPVRRIIAGLLAEDCCLGIEDLLTTRAAVHGEATGTDAPLPVNEVINGGTLVIATVGLG